MKLRLTLTDVCAVSSLAGYKSLVIMDSGLTLYCHLAMHFFLNRYMIISVIFASPSPLFLAHTSILLLPSVAAVLLLACDT